MRMYSPAEVARRYVETGKEQGGGGAAGGKDTAAGDVGGGLHRSGGDSAPLVSYGGRLARGGVFPAGLKAVLLAGSELFTGTVCW